MNGHITLAILASALCSTQAPANTVQLPVDGGQVLGAQMKTLRVFKGVPYADPPVKQLRWRPPQPVSPWQGVRKAVAYSPACPQIGNYPTDAEQEPTSEDCLTLNVWTPAAKGSAKLPVMVWIHGGGLMNGSGSVPQYAGDQLASRGVVVVTLNYRLGVLGFLSHPELNKESPDGISGNYGLLDQIAALKWVQRNISTFGGDPDRVTIFGQSSGAFSVSMLVASPLAQGLFRRAIGQSGGVFEPVELDPSFTPSGAAEGGERFATRAGKSTIAELRKLPADLLLKARFSPQYVIGGDVLPLAPHDAYVSNRQNKVDLLVGSNTSEGSFFFDPKSVTVANFNSVLAQTYPSLLLWAVGASPGRSDAEARDAAVAIDTDMRFAWDMWAWARLAAKDKQRRVFLYRFAGKPAYRASHPLYGLGPTHGGELPFVFGNLDPRAADWTVQDHALAQKMQQYWVNFAKTGDPNGPGLPIWQQFDARDGRAMQLGQPTGEITLTDETRLKRIDRVYSVARFISGHRNGLLAIGAGVVALFLFFLVKLLPRLAAQFAGRRRHTD